MTKETTPRTDSTSEAEENTTEQPKKIERVFVTGATGFVGRHVVRELVLRGYIPVCLVRSRAQLASATRDLDQQRITSVAGRLTDVGALHAAAEQSDAAIHLVGIILENRLKGQTFDRVHRLGTTAVVNAVREAGIRRHINMSALGSRPNAVADYHRTKYAAEECVWDSGLDWTIFRPSIIHGHDGEFMQLMKTFACSLIPPIMPYFGTGDNRLQPVSVKDVAYCFVEALRRDATISQTYSLGGPRPYSWKEMYALCRRLIPGAKRWKPMVSQPVPIAKMLAMTVMKTPFVPPNLKFNIGQVQMSQEDSVCAIEPVEEAFDIKLRDFESELARYAPLIR